MRSAFGYDSDLVSTQTALVCLDDSLTVQSASEDADINTIVRRFGLTGTMPVASRLPTFGDFTGCSDYREALELIRQADDSFSSYPAELRAKFDNDAAKFLDYVETSATIDELRQWGLSDNAEVKQDGLGSGERRVADRTGGSEGDAL